MGRIEDRTGESLTVRQKTTRREEGADGSAREVANRRVFYDFTLSPPKSVSIVALVGGDERIVKAHDHATRIALSELEKFAATRVRSAGASSDRVTSNVVAAVFRHDTSRALDPPSAQSLHPFQCDPRRRGRPMEGVAELRHAPSAEV